MQSAESEAEFRWLTPVHVSSGEISFAVFVGLLTFGFPWLAEALVERLGVRGFAGLLLLLAVAGLLASRSLARRVPLGRAALLVARIGLLVLPALSLVLGTLQPLLFVPALIQGALALLFLGSLVGGDSLIETVIYWMVPVAPDFVRPYCRGLTAIWGLLFLAGAAAIAWVAASGDAPTWRSLCGSWIWIGMAIFSAAEFLVRKSYFRNYFHRGPFERFWERLFPAEATPMGRRSHAYIEEMRLRMQGAQEQRFQRQDREG